MADRAKYLLWTIVEVLTIAAAAVVIFLAGSYASMALSPIEEPAHWAVVQPSSLFTEAELSDQYAMRQTMLTMIYDLEVSLGHAPNYDEHEATYVLEFYSDYKCEE